jgi:hypothetical protein
MGFALFSDSAGPRFGERVSDVVALAPLDFLAKRALLSIFDCSRLIPVHISRSYRYRGL